MSAKDHGKLKHAGKKNSNGFELSSTPDAGINDSGLEAGCMRTIDVL